MTTAQMIITAIGVLAAWIGVFFSFKAVADRSHEKFENSIAKAIKIGILEARAEILKTVADGYVPLEQHESFEERLKNIEKELQAMKESHTSIVARLANAGLAMISALHLIAGTNVHKWQAKDMLKGPEDQLREML